MQIKCIGIVVALFLTIITLTIMGMIHGAQTMAKLAITFIFPWKWPDLFDTSFWRPIFTGPLGKTSTQVALGLIWSYYAAGYVLDCKTKGGGPAYTVATTAPPAV
jgi:hypothetical protein